MTKPCLNDGRLFSGKGSYCPACQAQRNRARDRRRGTAHDRGYTSKWRGVSRPVWQGQPCHYCGAPAEGADHVVPKKHNGSDDVANLVPACARCNSSKGGR